MKHLFILIVALYLFIPSYLYGQNPKPSAKEIYELNEKCGKHAATLFKKEYGNGFQTSKDGTMFTSYTNHYNVKLNKCFVLMTTTSHPNKKEDVLYMKELWDINENKQYGSMARFQKESTPIGCSVENRICKSEGEWDSLIKPYIEE